MHPFRQKGMVVWLLLMLFMGATGLVLQTKMPALNQQQRAMQLTLHALSRAQQALLAYAQQPLGTTQCELNCPRPGDLPCPDRDDDGIAETSCSNTARLGRLPWKTLGLGDLRDGSGERLWYAVSNNYKNNPRRLPLNADTPGTWSVQDLQGHLWDASLGQGVVAVLIAPMQPVQRQTGGYQERSQANRNSAAYYLDQWANIDNAAPLEFSAQGFIVAPASDQFNDVVWPVLTTTMHRRMQQQVVDQLKRMLRCQSPCTAMPAPAALEDSSCLENQTLTAGSCLSASGSVGRLPLDSQGHWPLAANHPLDGDARHHWFQQNGWREQVFYQSTTQPAMLVVAGEALSPASQPRQLAADKSQLSHYIEASTRQRLQLPEDAAAVGPANDILVPVH